jgi:hypothetical protein
LDHATLTATVIDRETMSTRHVTLADTGFSVESLLLPARGKGEDVALLRQDFVAIADGSTPLLRGKNIDAHAFAEHALEALATAATLPVREMFENALKSLASTARVSEAPSCTIGLVRPVGDELEAAVLGDCTVVVTHRDSSHTVLKDERLQDFDERIARTLAADIARGSTEEEATENAREALVRNRDLANRPETYWLFSGNKAAAEHVLTATVPRADVESVLLCSDGFARLVHPFRLVEDEQSLADAAVAQGLLVLGKALRTAEEAAESMVDYPRLSTSDDASALLLRRDS